MSSIQSGLVYGSSPAPQCTPANPLLSSPLQLREPRPVESNSIHRDASATRALTAPAHRAEAAEPQARAPRRKRRRQGRRPPRRSRSAYETEALTAPSARGSPQNPRNARAARPGATARTRRDGQRRRLTWLRRPRPCEPGACRASNSDPGPFGTFGGDAPGSCPDLRVGKPGHRLRVIKKRSG